MFAAIIVIAIVVFIVCVAGNISTFRRLGQDFGEDDDE